MQPSIIAIDGPAASGKSTIGELIAARLNYLFFDTGILYRAVTFAALERGLDVNAEQAVTHLAEHFGVDLLPPTVRDHRLYTVMADGQDVTWKIREPRVDANVSVVSAYAGVRRAMMAQQRRIGQRGRVVMVGRDIGTVVLPEAELKIYLDATLEERARRRHDELVRRGQSVKFDEVKRDLERRDQIDSTRAVAPLKQADDAQYLDSTGMDIPHVVARVQEWVQAHDP